MYVVHVNYLHFVFLVGVGAQQEGCGLDLIGEFSLGQLGPKRLQGLSCFLYHQCKTFDSLTHTRHNEDRQRVESGHFLLAACFIAVVLCA